MFSIPEIPIFLDEHQYIQANDLLAVAGSLAGDGQGGELGSNTEYERGMAEIIIRYMGWENALAPFVIRAIHGYARDNARPDGAQANSPGLPSTQAERTTEGNSGLCDTDGTLPLRQRRNG